jgi:hypothetical protein
MENIAIMDKFNILKSSGIFFLKNKTDAIIATVTVIIG